MGFIEIYKPPKYSSLGVTALNGRTLRDLEIAQFVKQHSHWWDRLNYHKMCDACTYATGIMSGELEAPDKKNWTFNDVIRMYNK